MAWHEKPMLLMSCLLPLLLCALGSQLGWVVHSGNLIIRAALTEPVLKAYLPALWLFLSLSGPHLGYLCSANKLFCSGMWLFKKFTAGP